MAAHPRRSPPRPAQRTEDELELIFEELLHIKAVAHLSNSVSVAVPCFPHSVYVLPNLLLVPKSSCIPSLPNWASSPGPLEASLGTLPTLSPVPMRVPSLLSSGLG